MVSRSLILVLCLMVPVFVQLASRAQSQSQATSEEAGLRAVIERYFAAYGRKDLGGVLSLWSEKSPDLAASRKRLEQQFAGEDLSFDGLALSRIKVENEKARLRAT